MEFKIGSFNLNQYGYNSTKDIEKIAEIIQGEGMDIIALQEVFGRRKNECIAEELKSHLIGWELCFDKDNKNTDGHSDEGYCYLWNTKVFKLLEYKKTGITKVFEPRIINSLSNDVNVDCSVFARTPYYIRLQPINGGFFELRLINVHIYHGNNLVFDIEKRKEEYKLLINHIYPDISQNTYGTFRVPYTIAMGDYNLSLFQSCSDNKMAIIPMFSYFMGTQTIQQELSTLRIKSCGYANNYDHFSYDPDTSPFRVISCGRVNAVDKYCMGNFEYYLKNVSDHLPIQLTIDI